MKLIDADALADDVKTLRECAQYDMGSVSVLIKYAPTVDAEPVVHCGDCKFRCDFMDGHCECRRWPNIPMSYQRVDPQFDFCSYGEKENT